MKKIIVTLIILSWILTLSYITIWSKELKISELSIIKNNYVPTKLIEETLSPLKNNHLLSLLFSGNLRKQLEDDYPQIKNIKLKIKWPNTVQVIIDEKKEWGIFIQTQKDYIIATDGTILNKLPTNYHIQNLENLIIVKGLSESVFENETINSKLVESIEKTRKEIENFEGDIPIQYEFNIINELSLLYNDEVIIKIGKLEYIKEKFNQLNRFLKVNSKSLNKINYIDLRNKDKVVVSYNK